MKKHGRRILFLLMAAFFAVNIWVFMLGQNEVINIVEFEVYSDKVEIPVTIAQLSDLHEKSFERDNSDLFETVRSVRPDLIVITGDIIYNSYTDSPNLPYMENLAKGCAEIAPTFFITGNHDRYHPQAVKEAFARNGVVVLEGEVVPFAVGNTVIRIGGIDDPSIDRDSISGIDFRDGEQFNLLLAHRPDTFRREYVQTGADLVLTGHTHGGQIRLPWTKAIFYADGGLFPEYSDGLYTSGGTTMIISMGLGSSVVPFRLFAQPEVTVTRLLPAGTES
ncbi:metallophosphoesterase [Christensenella intestinihominis]|uniref:metallophosphoesterase n=1 Tax=Christensenella intestinihominis TaxID=1851429 RepID=UPI00083610A8|nr:metallophosphoesterase [Christensenella intestinihominis]